MQESIHSSKERTRLEIKILAFSPYRWLSLACDWIITLGGERSGN